MTQTLIEKYNLQRFVGVVSAPNVPMPPAFSEKRRLILTDILEKETLGIEKNAIDAAIADALQTTYPTIDPSFLSMKHPDPKSYSIGNRMFKAFLPRFAVYSLDSSDCVVAMTVRNPEQRSSNVAYCADQSVEKPELPYELSRHLITAISITTKSTGYVDHEPDTRYTFSSQFMGCIPNDIKDNIKIAGKAFGKELYVIAEVNSWKIEEVRKLRPTGDPLVVGVKGQRCFLVSEFNCTPLEDYVKIKFGTDERN